MERWTWRGMCGNGSQIGMTKIIIRAVRTGIPQGQGRERAAFFAAVAMAAAGTTCGRRLASTMILTTRTTASGFVVPRLRSTFCFFLLKKPAPTGQNNTFPGSVCAKVLGSHELPQKMLQQGINSTAMRNRQAIGIHFGRVS